MEFEEIENGIKSKISLITEDDIKVINNDFDGIVNRFSKMIIKDKDLAKAQYIIKKQQEQIEELKRNSISKKKIREKLKEVQLPNVIVGGRRNGKTLEYGIKLGRIKAYEELLEEK